MINPYQFLSIEYKTPKPKRSRREKKRATRHCKKARKNLIFAAGYARSCGIPDLNWPKILAIVETWHTIRPVRVPQSLRAYLGKTVGTPTWRRYRYPDYTMAWGMMSQVLAMANAKEQL